MEVVVCWPDDEAILSQAGARGCPGCDRGQRVTKRSLDVGDTTGGDLVQDAFARGGAHLLELVDGDLLAEIVAEDGHVDVFGEAADQAEAF